MTAKIINFMEYKTKHKEAQGTLDAVTIPPPFVASLALTEALENLDHIVRDIRIRSAIKKNIE